MLFLIVTVTILTIIYFYTGIRIILPAKLKPLYKSALWGGLFIFYIILPAAIALRFANFVDDYVRYFYNFAFMSFGFFVLAFMFLFIRDISLFFYKILTYITNSSSGRNILPFNPSRRSFLVNGSNLAVLGITGTMTGCGMKQAMKLPELKEVDIFLKNLPEEFNGFRIVQITDLHVGMGIRRDYVQKIVMLANAAKGDLIVFTGDLADGRVDDLRSETAPLADLEAPLGKFFVTGNHEYYSGVESWLDEIEQLGFVSLINEHRIIQSGNSQLVLAGITDYRAGRMKPGHESNPEAALSNAPAKSVKIMLAHQPKSIYGAEAAGADFVISGHTHGGQFVPFNYLVPLEQPYIKGLHKYNKTWIYVSKGTGYWGPPLRAGVPSEIAVLRLLCDSRKNTNC